MFQPGDVVRIYKEYLEDYEDPNQDYIVFEDYGNGRVKVFCPDEKSAFGGYIYVWADYMFYKVGHVDISKEKRD